LALLILPLCGFSCAKTSELLERFFGTKATQITATYVPPQEQPEVNHIKTPEIVRGIYITSYTAGSVGIDKLAAAAKGAGINSFVIDIKDYRGNLAFAHQDFGDFSPQKPYYDIEKITKKLHQDGFYLIGRIPIFEDTYLAEKKPKFAVKNKSGGIWRDRNGLAWVDPAAREVWLYNLKIAKIAYSAGFDEINFDYIRFPSDGIISDIIYPYYKAAEPKEEIIKLFFGFLNRELRGRGVPISADLFGITLWRDHAYNIGQKFLDALPNFDFISPMAYPSHFPSNFEGYKNPADHPYEIMKRTLIKGLEIAMAKNGATPEYKKEVLAKYRPWLQAFDMGAIYNREKIFDEVRGTCDAGATRGWLFWNARNVYNFNALSAKQTCD